MVSIVAGRRDRRIRIEQPLKQRTDRGAETVTWVPYGPKAWAEIAPLRGNESIEAQALQARFDTTIRTLFIEGVRTEMRIVATDTGQIYDIRHVAEIGRRDGLEIQCTAREDDEV